MRGHVIREQVKLFIDIHAWCNGCFAFEFNFLIIFVTYLWASHEIVVANDCFAVAAVRELKFLL